MAFTNQFAITLEATALAPFVAGAHGKGFEAAVSFARDLQNSRSDIVVEEDLAGIFGRYRIEHNIESSFRTIMAAPSDISQLRNGIGLFTGAGPTVVRALREPQYLTTVIQCSFLVNKHERSSLASTITNHFENILADAPDSQARIASPRTEAVQSTLRAYEDQTSRYDWQAHLLAVATLLGLEESHTNETIPPAIIRGLLLMFPSTQKLPEERCIAIETPQGACSIVVWAHILLGLSVVVWLNDSQGVSRRIRFPQGEITDVEQLLVDAKIHSPEGGDLNVPVHGATSITLLTASTKEELFKLRADTDEDLIESTLKGPAQGFARRTLDRAVPHKARRKRVVEEMTLIACSFSICIARKAQLAAPGTQAERIDSTDDEELSDEDEDAQVPYRIPQDRILDACHFLFGPIDLESVRTIEDYVQKYAGRWLYAVDMPLSIKDTLKHWGPDGIWHEAESCWPRLRLVAQHISVLILAFAHVTDLAACRTTPICEKLNLISKSDLCMSVLAWNGDAPVPITQDAWFQLIVLMMMGQTGTIPDLQRTSVLSNRGWSVFVSSIGDADLSYLGKAFEHGTVTIARGVPWRNGIWSHVVLDGPQTSRASLAWKAAGNSGDTVSSTSISKVWYEKPMVGERDGCFIVTLRIASQTLSAASNSIAIKKVRRTGYNELWCAMGFVEKTTPCGHARRLGEQLTLEPEWTALHDFGDNGSLDYLGRVRICLTADNTPARWRAMLSVLVGRNLSTRLMLRDDNCCVACAAMQAAALEGTVYLVL